MRFPLAVNLESRDGTVSKDSKVLNGIIEVKGEARIEVRKRPGLSDVGLGKAGVAQALTYWNGAITTIQADYLNRGTNTAVTWSTTDKGAQITLSNSNLTATQSAATSDGVRATMSKTSGLWFAQFTNPTGTSAASAAIGVANSTWGVTSDQLGSSTNSIAYRADGTIVRNAVTLATVAAWEAGDVFGIAMEVGVSVKFYRNGTLVYTATTIPTGTTWYFAYSGRGGGTAAAVTVNFGATSLTYAAPSGYSTFASTSVTTTFIPSVSTALSPSTASLPFSVQDNGSNAPTSYLMFKNATQGWTLDVNGTIAAITDVDYPGTYAVTLTSLTRSGTTATATVATDTNFQVGSTVTIAGAGQADYNGAQTITGVTPTSTVEYPSITGTITRSSTTATFTSTSGPHGLVNGQTATIAGANEAAYNGDFVITWVSATVFTYTVTVTTGGSSTQNYNLTSPATAQSGQSLVVYVPAGGGNKVAAVVVNAAGTTATFTRQAHGFSSGQEITAMAANNYLMCDNATVTVVDVNSFTAPIFSGRETFFAGVATTANVTPYFVVTSSITASGSTATVTFAAAHNFTAGDVATVGGAAQTYYNGAFNVTITGSTTLTYQLGPATTVSDSPASPATGIINARRQSTITGSSFTFTVANSPVTPATGTITATGGRNTVPGIGYLDGYFAVMDDDGVIYTSAEDAPATWNALEYTIAQADTGAGKWIGNSLNFIVALKEWSTEPFYNAANATGSPLSPQLSSFTKVGCASGFSVAELEAGVLAWIAQTRKRGRSVYLMSGMQQKKVSTPDIDRILNADDLATVHAWGATIDGHALYILTLVTSDITLVYDMTSDTWTEASSYTIAASKSISSITRSGTTATVTFGSAHGLSDGEPFLISGATQTDYNGIFQASYSSTTVVTIEVANSPTTPATGTILGYPYTETYFKFTKYADCNGEDMVLHESDGHLYSIEPAISQDAGLPVNYFGRVTRMDGATTVRKKNGRLSLICASPVSDTAMLRWSDDDCATFVAYRRLTLSDVDPMARRCGAFVRRTLEWRHTGNTSPRFEGIEPRISEG